MTVLICSAQAPTFSHGQIGTFTAKVVLEDGTPLPHEPLVTIRTNMGGGCKIHQIFGNGTIIYSAWTFETTTTTDECPVEIRLEGFRMKIVTLRDAEVIALKRLGESEGVVAPASSSSAPRSAAKAYAKGVEALRKGRFAEAEKQLQNAVSLYPDYAAAYSDLGEALEKQKKFPDAQAAYEKALTLSPKYLKPYAQLARLEISRNAMDRALDITDRALKLNPIDMPSIYYYRALALWSLRKLDEAEQNVNQAIENDVDKQLPRAPYLLGLILEQKGDRDGAAQAFTIYAHWKPAQPDAGEAAARAARLK